MSEMIAISGTDTSVAKKFVEISICLTNLPNNNIMLAKIRRLLVGIVGDITNSTPFSKLLVDGEYCEIYTLKISTLISSDEIIEAAQSIAECINLMSGGCQCNIGFRSLTR